MSKQSHEALVSALLEEWKPSTQREIAKKFRTELQSVKDAMRISIYEEDGSSRRRRFKDYLDTSSFTSLEKGLRDSSESVRSLSPGMLAALQYASYSPNDIAFIKNPNSLKSEVEKSTARRRINLKGKLATLHVEMMVHTYTYGQTPMPWPLFIGICCKLGGLSNRYMTFLSLLRIIPSLSTVLNALKDLATSKVKEMQATMNAGATGADRPGINVLESDDDSDNGEWIRYAPLASNIPKKRRRKDNQGKSEKSEHSKIRNMFRPGQGRDDSILQVKDFLYYMFDKYATLDTEQRTEELDASWNSYRPMDIGRETIPFHFESLKKVST